jgi:hypothetical protein
LGFPASVYVFLKQTLRKMRMDGKHSCRSQHSATTETKSSVLAVAI